MTDRELLIDIRNQIDSHLSDEVPISDLQAEIIRDNTVKLTWKAHKDGEMDIEYYSPNEEEWKHSYATYVESINIQDESVLIGFAEPITSAKFRAVKGSWISEAVEVKKSDPDTKYIFDYSGNNIVQGDPYLGWIYSVVPYDSKVRIYFEERSLTNPNRIRVFETSNLRNWTKLPDVDRPIHGVMYHNGWKAWGEEDGWMCLYESTDGIHFNRVKKAFTNWAFDTKFSCVFDENRQQYVMFGRVRGVQSPESGGFGDDLNRRGISRHKSKTDDWTSDWYDHSIVCDPMDFWDYNTKSPIDAPDSIIDSQGTERKGHGLIRYDFYAPNVFMDGGYKAYPVVFWRSGNRIVDRGGDNPFSDRDKVTQNRWRYVGEWRPIEMKSDEGKKWEIVNENPFDTYKEPLPEPPYIGAGENIKQRFTDQPQTPMMDVAPFEFKGQKYVAISQMGRHYFQIADTKITAGIEIRKA